MAPKTSGYSRIQIILHWVIALLIVFQFVGAEAIESLVAHWGIESASDAPEIPALARAHVLLGLFTFALMLLRVLLRFVTGAPALPENDPRAQKILAHITHGVLYLALLLMPLSGALAWFGQSALADSVHLALRFVLVLFVALHVGAALYHQLVLKDGLIGRMLKAG